MTRTIEVRLANGKRRDVRLSDSDDVLTVHQRRDPALLVELGPLMDAIRELHGLRYSPMPHELRRTDDGLVVVGMSAAFALKAREALGYLEVPGPLVREVLERAGRDEAEIDRWCPPPKTDPVKAKGPRKKRGATAQLIGVLVGNLAEDGPWGWPPKKVAQSARCSVGYLYRRIRDDHEVRRNWKTYLGRSKGRGPSSPDDL